MGAAPLADVIGDNAREFRMGAGLTLDQVSRAARARGLKWSESRVADFEAGRVASPSLSTLLAFVLALADAGCPEITLPGLVKYIPAPLRINDSLELIDGDIVNLLAGERVTRALSAEDVVVPAARHRLTTRERRITQALEVNISVLGKVAKAQGAAEMRMCKALNIDPMVLAHMTGALWKKTFSEERDRRAGEGANAQKRGQVSRAMQEELETAIERVLRGRH